MSNSDQQTAKQAGKDFDSLAGQVTALFNRIQAQPTITAADLATATNAYQQLAQIVASAGAQVPYIAAQWALPSYQAAYEARLQQIASKVIVDDPAGYAAAVNQQAAGSQGAAAGAVAGVSSSTLLLLAGVGVLAWVMLKR